MPAVLLITHDELLATAYRARLTKAGFEVEHCRTGNEGLAAGRRRVPDVILLDLVLPGLHGLDFLKWVTDLPVLVKVPVILLVERTVAPETLRECRVWGASSHLEKDRASLADVVACIRATLQPSPAV